MIIVLRILRSRLQRHRKTALLHVVARRPATQQSPPGQIQMTMILSARGHAVRRIGRACRDHASRIELNHGATFRTFCGRMVNVAEAFMSRECVLRQRLTAATSPSISSDLYEVLAMAAVGPPRFDREVIILRGPS